MAAQILTLIHDLSKPYTIEILTLIPDFIQTSTNSLTNHSWLNPLLIYQYLYAIFPHAQNTPTTGFTAIMVALRLCDKVSVAGFGYNLKEPNSPLHYYSQGQKMSLINQSFTHNIPMEKKTLYKLVQEGIIVDLTNGIHLGLWVRFRIDIERRNFEIILEYSYTPSYSTFCDKRPTANKCLAYFQQQNNNFSPDYNMQRMSNSWNYFSSNLFFGIKIPISLDSERNKEGLKVSIKVVNGGSKKQEHKTHEGPKHGYRGIPWLY